MKKKLAKLPLLGPALLMLYRFLIGFKTVRPLFVNLLKWTWTSRETTNFTYDLTELNMAQLGNFVAHICKKPYPEIKNYMDEILNNTVFLEHIAQMQAQSSHTNKADMTVRLGRRVGWYAVVRATKPKLVIETGVDKGLGSCVLCAALLANKQEGYEGQFLGTDINPEAGYLLQTPYNSVGKILYGDSIESLKTVGAGIDLFINDSDHSAEYEADEYRVVAEKMSKNGIILGDNSSATDKLHLFALETGRKFLYFQEVPKAHWYGGAGIDLFINDSDHSAEYEADEYRVVAEKMSKNGIILGDNSSATDKLHLFALETGRKFLYFQEVPKAHWYGGAGIGAAYFD